MRKLRHTRFAAFTFTFVAALLIAAFAPVTAPVGQDVALAATPDRVFIFSGNRPVTTSFTNFGLAVGMPVDQSSLMPDDLSAYACVLLPGNQDAFDVQQSATLMTYVNQGGHVIAVSDNEFLPDTISTMNGLMATFGSSIMIEPNQLGGLFGATTFDIAASEWTAGVASIVYRSASVARPGASAHALVNSTEGEPLIATEQVSSGNVFVVGDLEIFDDVLAALWDTNDNDVLAANFCTPGEPEPEEVVVDIAMQPFDGPSEKHPALYLKRQVAILGSAEFDLGSIDPESVRFGPAMATPDLVKPGQNEIAKTKDVNGDGIEDLLFTFIMAETGLTPADTEACLSGAFYDGTPFSGCTEIEVQE